MLRRPRLLPAVLALGVIVMMLVLQPGKSAEASSPGGRCQVTVPTDWGDFIGSSQYGLAFRDNQGTLRFVTQLPCGLDSTPHIALQISRK